MVIFGDEVHENHIQDSKFKIGSKEALRASFFYVVPAPVDDRFLRSFHLLFIFR